MIKGPFGITIHAKPKSLDPPKILSNSNQPKPSFNLDESLQLAISRYFGLSDYLLVKSSYTLAFDAEPLILLDSLRSTSTADQVVGSTNLLYFALGSFQDKPIQTQLEYIIRNNEALFELGALKIVFAKLCAAIDSFIQLASFTAADFDQQSWSVLRDQVSRYFCIFYILLVVNANHKDICVHVDALAPNINEYLFQKLLDITNSNRQKFPMKKLVLLLEKTLAISIGFTSPMTTPKVLKSNIHDYNNFFSDIYFRYPQYFLPTPNELFPDCSPKVLNPVSTTQFFAEQINSNSTNGSKATLSAVAEFRKSTPNIQPFISATDSIPPAFQEAIEIYKKYNNPKSDTVKYNQELLLKRIQNLLKLLQPKMSTYINMLSKLLYHLNTGNNDIIKNDAEIVKHFDSLDAERRQGILEYYDSQHYSQAITKSITSIIKTLLKSAKLFCILASFRSLGL
jgi:hypothetical protein